MFLNDSQCGVFLTSSDVLHQILQKFLCYAERFRKMQVFKFELNEKVLQKMKRFSKKYIFPPELARPLANRKSTFDTNV